MCSGWLSSYLHTQLFFSGILQLWRQVYIRPYGTHCSTGNSSSTSNEDTWGCHSNFFLPVCGMSTLFHHHKPCLLQSLLLHTGMLPEEQWLAVRLAWASAKLSSDSVPKDCAESGHVLVLYKDGIWYIIPAPTLSMGKVRKYGFVAPEWGHVWAVGTHSSAVPTLWAASVQPPCLGLFTWHVDSGFLSRSAPLQKRARV